MNAAEPLVVDTMVFGWLILRKSGNPAILYHKHLIGKSLVLSFQTVAELRYAALKNAWGLPRRADLEERIRSVAVAPGDDRLAEVYASLKKQCFDAGHGLCQKLHDGDRWIAATAIRHNVPLVSHDKIFKDVPGLSLVTELP